jgi:hypothetical protein
MWRAREIQGMSNREDLAHACDWFGESSVFGLERTGFLWTAFLAF